VGAPTELIDALGTAVPFALREMAGIEAVVRDTGPESPADGSAGVSAQIRLTTAAGGAWRLVMSFPPALAALLAGRILAGTGAAGAADMVRDCAGEVANVVAGQAKALLVGSPYHFTLSVPTVAAGPPASAPGGWVIRFDSDAGPFTAHLFPE
jgi:CheY-specific phosphatase CheX